MGGYRLGGLHTVEPARDAPIRAMADGAVPGDLDQPRRTLRLPDVAHGVGALHSDDADPCNRRLDRMAGAARQTRRGLPGGSPADRDDVRDHGLALPTANRCDGGDAAGLRSQLAAARAAAPVSAECLARATHAVDHRARP